MADLKMRLLGEGRYYQHPKGGKSTRRRVTCKDENNAPSLSIFAAATSLKFAPSNVPDQRVARGDVRTAEMRGERYYRRGGVSIVR